MKLHGSSPAVIKTRNQDSFCNLNGFGKGDCVNKGLVAGNGITLQTRGGEWEFVWGGGEGQRRGITRQRGSFTCFIPQAISAETLLMWVPRPAKGKDARGTEGEERKGNHDTKGKDTSAGGHEGKHTGEGIKVRQRGQGDE
ncbi:hypothetical protein E2C01_102363 [Portunus trituberculatus]|uniref:Uncharacterized protein n=1 Tax=Portunus trituberculatus TaxID=210409 RepID=A0A5B7KIC7_PORTR|nr:hypothetical protein [Portunus trituberculatus]